ncbi:hypothetical protein ABIA65_000185 [Mycolicibacterium sp. 624]
MAIWDTTTREQLDIYVTRRRDEFRQRILNLAQGAT